MKLIEYAIDLGTTNTVVAAAEYINGNVECRTIEVDQDYSSNGTEKVNILPSAVYISPKNGKPYIGQYAIEKGKSEPGSLLKNTKRFLGREDYQEICGEKYGSTKVSEIILKRCREAIERDMKTNNVDRDLCSIDIIISVPISYGNDQIKLTKTAAVQAGFKEEHIKTVKEPFAALLDYILNQNKNNINFTNEVNVLVYDIGGGTCDVCCINICKKKDTVFNLIGSVEIGSEGYGGIDFDRAIANELISDFYEKNKIEKRTLSDGYKKMIDIIFLEEAEKAKKQIKNKTSVYKNNILIGLPNRKDVTYHVQLDYENYKRYICDLISISEKGRMIQPINYMIKKLEISKEYNKIDYVLLMGGMSNSIFIREMIESRFENSDIEIIIPDNVLTAIAKGAALRHFDIQNKIKFGVLKNGQLLNDINGKSDRSILMDVEKGRLVELIKEDTFLPYSGVFEGKFQLSNRTKISVNLVSCFNSQLNTMKRLNTYTSEEIEPVLEEHYVNLKVSMNNEYELNLTAVIVTKDSIREVPLKQMNMKYY